MINFIQTILNNRSVLRTIIDTMYPLMPSGSKFSNQNDRVYLVQIYGIL